MIIRGRVLRAAVLLALASTAVMWQGCRRANPFSQDREIARVGDAALCESDVQSLFTPGITPQDSMKLLESYVDVWVRKQLKVREAETVFSDRQADIEKLVDEYRNSLLIHRLEGRYVAANPDTVSSQEAIKEWYEGHKEDFVLDRALIKGVIVRLPENFRSRQALKDMMCGDGERYQDFIDTSVKNGFELHEFKSWVDLGEFTAYLPPAAEHDYSSLLTTRGVSEFRQAGMVWYVCVLESLKAGSIAPLERVSDVVARTVSNQRRQELLRNYEDSLFREADQRKEIEIRIH